MIYLTAHRVVSSTGSYGINVFLHECEGHAPLATGDVQTLARVADAPGALLDQATDLPPGGNRVRSYLDIVAADDTKAENLATVLARHRAELTTDLPAARVVEGIGLRFGAEFGLYDAVGQEFDALAVRAVGLLRGRGAQGEHWPAEHAETGGGHAAAVEHEADTPLSGDST